VVIWLQTRDWHGDLRIPASRPDFSQTRSLQECTQEQLRWLLRQEGFAGITRVDGDICEWQRKLDYRPTGLRDVGRMVCSEETIEEYGVEQDYFERWARESIAAAPHSAWQARVSGRVEILLRVGDRFMYFRPRNIEMRMAELCWAEVGAKRATEDMLRLLGDFEISFGMVGGESGWHILHSTLPWQEGKLLSLEGEWTDLDAGDDQNGRRLSLNG
jgi:hypothetical protein